MEREAIVCRYCGVNVQNVQLVEDNQAPTPPYSFEEVQSPSSNEVEDEEVVETEELTTIPLSSLFYIFPGIFLLLFSLFLLFFSENGLLTLKWDSSYWAVYLLLGLPLLFFGYRKLKKISN
ncbi:MAG: hypothetical protein JHC93_00985 [Parachlamydiales bacterium]|nr:hypothetical protein [Parachlamydiales bacterium]